MLHSDISREKKKLSYFKCSNECGFLGFHMPPKMPRFLNMIRPLSLHTFGLLFSVLLKMVTWFALLLPHWFWIDNECNFRIKSIKFNESFWEGPFYRPFSRPLRLKNSLVKSSQFWTWLWLEKQNKTCQFSNCWLTAVFKLLSILTYPSSNFKAIS